MRQLKITKSITNRESASLDKYLQEIGKEDLITVEEEVELAQRIKKGDQEALEKLTKANLRFVVSVAKQYQNQGLSLPDLINEGNLGLIKAVAEREPGVGVLHLDAHCDLRKAYEGFDYSHASIMYNVLQEAPGVAKIVQVGQRDYSEEERRLALSSPRVELFDDFSLCTRRFAGETWNAVCDSIVERLPERVYVSFDIDVLAMEHCPATGTPVPGGLTFNEAVWLVDRIAQSGRRIVGFDLCEVAPAREGTADANVGARVLFRLCGIALKTN